MTLALHVVAAVVALVAGAVVLLRRKGVRAHRYWGWGYTATLEVMAVTSFGVYELRDGPSVFHAVSVLTLVVLVVGIAEARRRRPGWRRRHAIFLPVSYLMLVVTGTAQLFDRLPLPSDALNAIVFLQLPACSASRRSSGRSGASQRPDAASGGPMSPRSFAAIV